MANSKRKLLNELKSAPLRLLLPLCKKANERVSQKEMENDDEKMAKICAVGIVISLPPHTTLFYIFGYVHQLCQISAAFKCNVVKNWSDKLVLVLVEQSRM